MYGVYYTVMVYVYGSLIISRLYCSTILPGVVVAQFFSSDWSVQSYTPSQRLVPFIHFSLSQVNSFNVHPVYKLIR